MSLRTTLKSLIRRSPAASLRERAAELHARIPTPKPQAAPPPATSGDADAVLLALASEWEAARNAYDQASQRQMEITTAAERDNRPGRAPEGSGPDWQAWFARCQEWRERTGIKAAEEASAEACRALGRVEDRITALPATTPAGLRLKARVAERNDEIGVEWPEGLGESLTRDLLVITANGFTDDAASADAELLALGSEFDAARMTEVAACEDCNAAQREVARHMPERPACLIYRASDAKLGVHQERMMAQALEGREVCSSDIQWLRQKMPMTHEILRPIRFGERAHIDHPGRKFDRVAHPEAQARAVEIVTAWDAWQTERLRVQNEHFPEALDDAANEAGDEAAALATRLAALPALTADGFRVKLRALSHYRRDTLLAEIPSEPDPDQLLSHSLWRDAREMLPAPTPANVLTAGILDLWREWAAKEEAEEYDEALQQRRFGLIDAAEALPATVENMGVKALALAWLEYVDHWRPRSGRSSYSTDGRLAIDIHAAASKAHAKVERLNR